MNLAKCSISLWRSLELLIKITAGYIDIAADSEFKKNQNSTNSYPEYKPVEKLAKSASWGNTNCFINSELQVGYADNTTRLNKVNKGRQKRRILEKKDYLHYKHISINSRLKVVICKKISKLEISV